LKEKQLKFPEGFKIPTAQELQGGHTASGITLSLTVPMIARNSSDTYNRPLSKAD
jgi:hypothetical protein